MTRRSVARAALAIAAVTVAARVVGFLRVAVFARTVGVDPLGDTYQTVNTLPNIVFEVVAGGALAAAVVPVIAGAVDRGDVERTRRTASALLTWVVLLLVPVALLGVVFARPLTSLLVGATDDPALRAAKVEVGARMLRIFAPQVVLYGVGIVLTGVLQAHRRFLGPALAPLLSSVVVIGCYVAFSVASDGGGLTGLTRGEELLLALGTTAGVAVLALSLLVPLRSLRLSLRPSLALPPGVAPVVRRLALAGVAGVAAQQVFLAVALRLTNAEPGAVVVHQVAYTVFLLPWAVLAVPVATSAYPAMAAAHDTEDDASYAAVTAASLRAVLLAMCLAAALLAAAAWPVAALVAGGDAVDPVARAVAAFAPGLVGYGVLALLTRALYARRLARPVAVATVAAFGIASVAAVLLATALPRADRVTAVALAASLGVTVGAVLLAVSLVRSAGLASIAGALRTLAVAAVAALLAAGCGALVAEVAGDAAGLVLAPLAVVAVFGAVVLTARLPAVAEVRALLPRLRREPAA